MGEGSCRPLGRAQACRLFAEITFAPTTRHPLPHQGNAGDVPTAGRTACRTPALGVQPMHDGRGGGHAPPHTMCRYPLARYRAHERRRGAVARLARLLACFRLAVLGKKFSRPPTRFRVNMTHLPFFLPPSLQSSFKASKRAKERNRDRKTLKKPCCSLARFLSKQASNKRASADNLSDERKPILITSLGSLACCSLPSGLVEPRPDTGNRGLRVVSDSGFSEGRHLDRPPRRGGALGVVEA